jgi:serine/threonine protein phosphatase PrpC
VSQLFSIETAARTEVGRCRTINQDTVALRPDLGLYLLADGMTGHAAGEVASAIAAEAMQQFYLNGGAMWSVDCEEPASDPRAFLAAAVQHANYRIWQLAELHPEYRGMGAAVAAVHVGCSGFCLAHVGHVRGYRFRKGALEPLTEDHTQLNRYLGRGVEYDVAKRMPDASLLARALGLHGRTRVTVRVEDARPGDLVVLVSNGLYNAVSDPQMARILAGRTPLAAMADALISAAQAHGAADDVTCVLLRCVATEEAPNLAA